MIDGRSTENNLGLDGILDEGEFDQIDVSDFEPRPKRNMRKLHKEKIRGATLEVGFQDRGGAVVPPSTTQKRSKRGGKSKVLPTKNLMRRSMYYRTGRSTQFNMKVRSEVRERFRDLCEAQEWVGGQALQYALDALQEKIENSHDPFWNDRNYRGVE